MRIPGRLGFSVLLCATLLAAGCGEKESPEFVSALLLTIDVHPEIVDRVAKVELRFSESPYDPEAQPASVQRLDLETLGAPRPPFRVLIWPGNVLDDRIAIRGLGLTAIQDLAIGEDRVEVAFDPARVIEALLCLAPPGSTCGDDPDADADTDLDADAAREAEAGGEGSNADGPAEIGDDAAERCEAGERRCVDTLLQECNPSGFGWRDVQYCPVTCIDGACAGCEPGSHRCEGDDLEVCDGEGMGWSWVETCEFGCRNAACMACQPDLSVCDEIDPTLRRYCLPDGSGMRTETCSKTCLDGRCTSCLPGVDAFCQANGITRMVCAADGMGYESGGDCCGANSCNNGICVRSAPWIHGLDPGHAQAWSPVTITVDGCNLVSGAKVHIRQANSDTWISEQNLDHLSSEYVDEATIRIHIDSLIDPAGTNDYYFRVKNPDGQLSNQAQFHVDT